MAADGWSNVLVAREGRYFQIMGSKDQQTARFTIDSRTGHHGVVTTTIEMRR
jgi:hypothetical protein